MDGWISIHRKITENPMWLSEPFTRSQAWIDLIILANHKDSWFIKRGIKVEIKRGQVGHDLANLAIRWRWSRGKVERFISILETSNQIVTQKTNITTLLSIVNYDTYQTGSKANSNPNSEANGHQTGKQTGKQTETNNNDNKDNKDNNVNNSPPNPPKGDGEFYGENFKYDFSKIKWTADKSTFVKSIFNVVGPKCKMQEFSDVVQAKIDSGFIPSDPKSFWLPKLIQHLKDRERW